MPRQGKRTEKEKASERELYHQKRTREREESECKQAQCGKWEDDRVEQNINARIVRCFSFSALHKASSFQQRQDSWTFRRLVGLFHSLPPHFRQFWIKQRCRGPWGNNTMPGNRPQRFILSDWGDFLLLFSDKSERRALKYWERFDDEVKKRRLFRENLSKQEYLSCAKSAVLQIRTIRIELSKQNNSKQRREWAYHHKWALVQKDPHWALFRLKIM